MIDIRNLRKDFGSFTAVQNVSLSTEPGEVFGLLGPKGAGKSTTIGCLSGLTPPSSGAIAIAGRDLATAPKAAKARLGVVPQELAIYEDLPTSDNLHFWGAAYGLGGRVLKSRVDEVLGVIGLSDRARDRPRAFSGGMKRRLNFDCGIVHSPDVLLLDEPTVGVDPQSRERLFDMVRAETARGRRCYIPPTTWRRPRRCATASPSSTRDARSPKAPLINCATWWASTMS